MYSTYAADPRARINLGIRRRLATLLDNDMERIKLMNSLLLSMPGSPIIYYGDEIGMGDNIYVGDRNGVRTPMQWSIDRNAGFSRADPQRLYLPVIMDPIYGYQAVNVEAQSRDPGSLLNWTRRILAVRRQHQCFGRGSLEFVRPQNRKIIAYVRTFGAEIVLCVANLSQTAQAVELDLSKYKGRVPVELMGRNAFPPIGELPYFLTLAAHGFFWMLLSDSAPPPAWHVERLPATELPVLVLSQELATFLADSVAGATPSSVARRSRQQLEQEVLPEFLRPRSWLAHDDGGLTATRLGPGSLWRNEHRTFLLSFVDAEFGGTRKRYFLPLALAWEDGPDTGALRTAEWTLAKVREHARVGVLIDAFADPAFCVGLVHCMVTGTSVPFAGGELRFHSTGEVPALATVRGQSISHVGADTTNTSVILDEAVFLKAYRRAEAGPNPDVEMTSFLTRAGYRSIAQLAGSVTHVTHADGESTVLAAVFAAVGHQGDVWTYALNHLERFATTIFAAQSGAPTDSPHALFTAQMQTLGRRVGQLHCVLARASADDPAFATEPLNSADQSRWYSAIHFEADTVLRLVRERAATLSDRAAAAAQDLLARAAPLLVHIRELCSGPVAGLKMRHHGNLHLGKVLLVADDLLITGFEGNAALTIEERRTKDSPLRDVATLLRSFDYARATALERVGMGRPDLREPLAPALDEWLRQSTEFFLRGYRRAVLESRCVPADDATFATLITLFQIDDALHELRRELEQRPTWIDVPIRALLSLAHSPKLSVS
jgi:maltose alpha-D-glucosyltransferase/alpha-amylase